VGLFTPKRSWFQFRLTTLFVLMVVVAMPCGWLAWKLERKRRERVAIAEIEKVGGGVLYDWQIERMRVLANIDDTENDAPGARWVRKLVGDDFFSKATLVCMYVEISDDQVVQLHLEALTELQSLELHGPHLTDAGLAHLKGLKTLKFLRLGNTGVTDAGLEHLKGLKRLESLRLDDTTVTDAGLRHVKALASLNELTLCDTRVTDAGLGELHGLSKLKALFLLNTGVTEAGVAELQAALPDCNIWMTSGIQYQPEVTK
jgi:hypothetical protein